VLEDASESSVVEDPTGPVESDGPEDVPVKSEPVVSLVVVRPPELDVLSMCCSVGDELPQAPSNNSARRAGARGDGGRTIGGMFPRTLARCRSRAFIDLGGS
jgi:hypothetical protein